MKPQRNIERLTLDSAQHKQQGDRTRADTPAQWERSHPAEGGNRRDNVTNKELNTNYHGWQRKGIRFHEIMARWTGSARLLCEGYRLRNHHVRASPMGAGQAQHIPKEDGLFATQRDN